jgi:alanine racemase
MACIRISKQNYFHNLSYLSNKAGGKDRLMAVLKDNAYGHDLKIMARLAHEFGINKCAVKSLQEALEIYNFFEDTLILADHPPLTLQDSSISFAVNSIECLKRFPKNSSIHLNIDSGMHRNGIKEEEIKDALEIILKNDLNLKGVFTHFRSADDLGGEQYWQEQNFKQVKKIVIKYINELGLSMPKFHSCNSASLLRRQSPLEDDFARCGIATYGYTHLHPSFGEFDLKPVMSLWANKLSSRKLKVGDRVGYGGMYTLSKDDTVSTYDIGYGDGFFRHDGKTKLILEGKEVLGRVSMDSLSMLGDDEEVCLFSDARYLAKKFNTISYEVITKLMPNIKREVI